MNDDALQKNNKDLPSETGSPYYMKMETFSALIKHIEKTTKVQDFMCQKLHLYTTETLGRNKRFVTCKPPGYEAMHLNPTTRGKLIFKKDPLDRVFPTWVMEGSPPH